VSIQEHRSLDIRLLRFRGSAKSEDPFALAADLYAAERFSEAIEVAQLGRQVQGDRPPLLMVEARSLIKEGKLQDAQELLIKVVRILPQDAEPLVLLGDVLLKRGDPLRAKKALERASLRAPADSELKKKLDRAGRLARIAQGSGADRTLDDFPRPGQRRDDAIPKAPRVPREGMKTLMDAADDSDTWRAKAAAEAGADWDDQDTRVRGMSELNRALEVSVRGSGVPRATEERPSTLRYGNDNLPQDSQQVTVETDEVPTAIRYAPTAEDLPTSPTTVETPTPPALTRDALGRASQPRVEPPPRPSAVPQDGGVFRMPPSEAPVTPAASGQPQAPQRKSRPSTSGLANAQLSETEEGVLAAPELHKGKATADLEAASKALRLISTQGVWESTQEPEWTTKPAFAGDVTRTRLPMLTLWLVFLALLGGGAWGFFTWRQARVRTFNTLLARAEKLIERSEFNDLRQAQRTLKRARQVQPQDPRAIERLLFVRLMLHLEEGIDDPQRLRSFPKTLKNPAHARAYREVLDAFQAVHQGEAVKAANHCRQLLAATHRDPRFLYLCGRLMQRAEEPSAVAYLQEANKRQPKFVAATLAYAEQLRSEDAVSEARSLASRADHANAVRPKLWSAWLSDESGVQSVTELEQIGRRIPREDWVDRTVYTILFSRALPEASQRQAAQARYEALATSPLGHPLWLLQASQEALQVGNAQVALALIKKAQQQLPAHKVIRKTLARVELSRGADSLVDKALEPLPLADLEVLWLRTLAWLRSENLEALRAHVGELDAWREAKDSELSLLPLHALALARLGDLDAAQTLANEGLQRHPDNPILLWAAAKIAFERHDTASSGALLKRIESVPAEVEPELGLLRGQVALAEGRTDEAVQQWKQVSQNAPYLLKSQLELAKLYAAQAMWSEAEQLFSALAAKAERLSVPRLRYEAVLGSARALAALGSYPQAEQRLQSLPEQERDRLDTKLAQLAVARGQGIAKEVLKKLNFAKHEGEQTAESLTEIGDAWGDADGPAEAKAFYERAIGVDPTYVNALLGRALVEIRALQIGNALDWLDKAEKKFETQRVSPLLLSRYYLIRGRARLSQSKDYWGFAREALRKAVDQKQVVTEAYFWLGEALAHEDAASAKQAYETYLKLEPAGRYAERANKALQVRQTPNKTARKR